MVIKYTHVANSILFSIISLFDLSVRLNLLNQFLSLKLLGFLIFVFFFSFETFFSNLYNLHNLEKSHIDW